MYGHGSQTREGWKLVMLTSLGTKITDWFQTEDAANQRAASYEAKGLTFVSLGIDVQILDF